MTAIRELIQTEQRFSTLEKQVDSLLLAITKQGVIVRKLEKWVDRRMHRATKESSDEVPNDGTI